MGKGLQWWLGLGGACSHWRHLGIRSDQAAHLPSAQPSGHSAATGLHPTSQPNLHPLDRSAKLRRQHQQNSHLHPIGSQNICPANTAEVLPAKSLEGSASWAAPFNPHWRSLYFNHAIGSRNFSRKHLIVHKNFDRLQ